MNGLKKASRDRAHLNPVFFAAKAGAYNETTGSLDRSQLHLLDLNSSRLHPDYDGTVYSPDIGFFVVDAEFTSGAVLLPREYVDELRLGQPIGTLGFPGEIGATFTPTFKDGVISAFRTNRRGTAAQNVAIQHNFDTTGGTSGSLIFDQAGWVIAVNHSGFSQGSLSFGIRVDEVWEFIDCCTTPATSPGRPGVASTTLLPQRPHPSATYEPFPEDWNGETILP